MGDIAFYMLDSGHSPKDVLSYELPYLYAFATKRVEVLEAQQPVTPPVSSTQTKHGSKKVTRKTAQELAEKARRQRKK